MANLFRTIHLLLLLAALVIVPYAAWMPGTTIEHVLRPLFAFIALFVFFTINLLAARAWQTRTRKPGAVQKK